MNKTHQAHTFCRICEALCGLEVTTEDGRITAIRPDTAHVSTDGFATYSSDCCTHIGTNSEGSTSLKVFQCFLGIQDNNGMSHFKSNLKPDADSGPAALLTLTEDASVTAVEAASPTDLWPTI